MRARLVWARAAERGERARAIYNHGRSFVGGWSGTTGRATIAERRAGRWKRVRGGVARVRGREDDPRRERTRGKWEVPKVRVKREAKDGGARG